MLYFITSIVFVLNLIIKKSKALYVFDFIFFMIVLGFSYGAYDTLIYIERYVNYQRFRTFTEILFNWIIEFFVGFGFNYRTFMIITSFIELFLIMRFIRKNSCNYCYVIALFIIYPMILMFEQLRFFMAFTIVLVGAIDNLINEKKFNKIKAIIYIIIASLIHSSCIIFLLLLLAELSRKKVLIIVSIVFVLLFNITIVSYGLTIVSSFIGNEKLAIIFSEISRLDGNYGRSFLVLFMFFGFIINYIYMYNDKNFYNETTEQDKKMMNLVLNYNIICLICVPLTVFVSPAFYRIPQSLMILNYICFSKYINYRSNNILYKKEFIFTILNLLYAISSLILLVHSKEAIDLIITPFFEENIFINYLIS